MAGNDGGQTAQFVSNASFAALALIYTVTELLDLSDRVRCTTQRGRHKILLRHKNLV